jgi:hypothetical protein
MIRFLLPAPRLALGVALLASIAGCGTGGKYVYRPEENATARVSGQAAALYRIPPEAPHGDVRIATLGIATLQPRGDDDDRIRTMHVRMIVGNNDDVAGWQLDTRQQIGGLDRYGQSRPAFASSSPGRPPVVTIAPSEKATIDLYYPLPEDMQEASEIPHFEVLWRVQTAQATVAERTSFERLRIEPPAPRVYYGWDLGWGTGWGWGPWYDPFWADYAFSGAPALAAPYYERPIVRGAPRPPPPRAR